MSGSALAQLPSGYMRYAKVGNSLREANQFEQAEYYLKRGLDEARQAKDRYWEAVTQEYLGLLYRDTNRNVEAVRSFNKAVELYNGLNMRISSKAILDLSSGLRGTGEDYAGVDIGSKGVKLSILSLSLNTRGQYEYAPKYDESKNTDPMVLSNASNEATLNAVLNYVSMAQTKYNIPKERIFVVASSGLRQEIDKKGVLEEFTNKVATPVTNQGVKFDYITPQQEAQYLSIGIVPPRQRQKVSVLDVGSGNTKGGVLVGRDYDPMSLPYGTKSFTNEVKKYPFNSPQEFANTARLLIDGRLKTEITDEVNRHPAIKNRPEVYLSGGIVWAISSYLYPEKINELFVELTVNDIRRFRDLATNNYQTLINPDLSKIDEDAVFEKAKKESERVQSTFEQEALIAGATWLEALLLEWNSSGPKKKIYFARQGVVGWLTGYMLNTLTEQYSKETE